MNAKRLLTSVLMTSAMAMGACVSQAYAQQPAASAAPVNFNSLTPAQQKAVVQGQQQQMTQAAVAVAQMVDQNKAADVWDGASSIAKNAVPKSTFIKQIADDRRQLGAVESRVAIGVNPVQSDGSKIPAGVYYNVAFDTQFAKAKAPVRELVSFHLDADKTWRLAGYTLR